jgi:hypothetical protein
MGIPHDLGTDLKSDFQAGLVSGICPFNEEQAVI